MNSKSPEIRFDEFTDDWEQRKLNKLAEFAKGSGYSKSDLKSEGTPVIHYGRLYTNYETLIKEVDTFVEAKENSIISKGNEVIVPASGETSEDISRASVVVKPGIILGGDLNIIKPNLLINSAFLALTISNGDQQKELTRRAQGKSVVHIRNSDLKEVNLSYPKVAEQNKIGIFFEQLENTIALYQRQLDNLRESKKGFLQKMFPNQGEKVPGIRFKEFTDAWERRKLGEYIEDYVEKTTIQNQYPVLTSSQRQGIVLQEEYFSNRQVTTNNNIGYFVLPRGYFTFRSRSDNDIFIFNRNDLIDKGIISYFYPVFTLKHADSNFFLHRINNGIQRQITIAAEGTGQHVLSLKKFKNISTMFSNLDEQQKMGAFFKQIDKTIDLHQQQLETLKQTKKAFLQKMFV